MRRSPPAFSAPSAQIAKSISKSDRNSIASINASSMISMLSSAPSASKPHDKGVKREQNPRYSHYNGLMFYRTRTGQSEQRGVIDLGQFLDRDRLPPALRPTCFF